MVKNFSFFKTFFVFVRPSLCQKVPQVSVKLQGFTLSNLDIGRFWHGRHLQSETFESITSAKRVSLWIQEGKVF